VFANNLRKYFIPAYAFNNLMMKLNTVEFSKCKNATFIERHLKFIEYIINHDQTYFNNIRKICGGTKGLGYQQHFDIIKDLIVSRGKYQVNGTAFNYQIKTDVDNWVLCYFENFKPLQKPSLTINLPQQHPVNNDIFIDTLKNTCIDVIGALNAEYHHCVAENYDIGRTIRRLNRIFAFAQSAERSIGKGKIVDRVYSSFTGLTSVSRPFVTYNNKYFTELDISNCQPLLLIAVLLQNNLKFDTQYQHDVVNGLFYSSMQNRAQQLNIDVESVYNTETRKRETLSLYDDIKNLCFRSIFFGNKSVKESQTVNVFSQLYPVTYQSLLTLQEKESSLAKLLQDLEAQIMLSVVPESPYFPVHDGFYCLNEAIVEDLQKRIQENFNKACGTEILIRFKVKRPVEQNISILTPVLQSGRISLQSNRERVKSSRHVDM
jgi:hypothetical protein